MSSQLFHPGGRGSEEEGAGLVSGQSRHPLQLEGDLPVVVRVVVERFPPALYQLGLPSQAWGRAAELSGEVRTVDNLHLGDVVTCSDIGWNNE